MSSGGKPVGKASKKAGKKPKATKKQRSAAATRARASENPLPGQRF